MSWAMETPCSSAWMDVAIHPKYSVSRISSIYAICGSLLMIMGSHAYNGKSTSLRDHFVYY